MKVGDSVRVKPGVEDVDFNYEISGWQGRVVEVTDEYVMVAWDSHTLRHNVPPAMITDSIEAGLSWTTYGFGPEELEPAEPRDTPADVEHAVDELEERHAWDGLGPEAELIQEVLAGINPDDDYELMKAWYAYMEDHLEVPFEAKVDEHQSRGPLRARDRVRVLDLAIVDDLYGVIVGLRHRRRHYDFPLCDLAALDQGSENHRIVQAYRVWFANR